MQRKLFVRFMVTALAVVALLSRLAKENTAFQEIVEKKPLALLLSQENEFLLDLKAAEKTEVKAQGYELLYYSADGGVETQLWQMHKAYAAGAISLFVNLADYQVTEGIAKATSTGIVLINRSPNDQSILNEKLIFAGCNEQQCEMLHGEALAVYFFRKEGSDIHCLMFQGVPGWKTPKSVPMARCRFCMTRVSTRLQRNRIRCTDLPRLDAGSNAFKKRQIMVVSSATMMHWL